MRRRLIGAERRRSVDKDKIIALIEQELVQADEAESEADFQKHIYAIHTLTSLYADTRPKSDNYQNVKPRYNKTYQTSSSNETGIKNNASQTAHSNITAAEIEAMGGKVSHSNSTSNTSTPPGNSNKMVTDDELGNGDSIFNF